MSILDLSEVRQVKTEKPKATIAQVKEALAVYRSSLLECGDLRVVQMRELIEKKDSKIQLVQGQDHPAQEIMRRIQFLDQNIVRFTDLLTAGAIVIDYETDTKFLDCFPNALKMRQEVIEAIVRNKDLAVHETVHADAALIAGYKDLRRIYESSRLGL